MKKKKKKKKHTRLSYCMGNSIILYEEQHYIILGTAGTLICLYVKPGTVGHFRGQCPALIPTRISVKITVRIKSHSPPWPSGGLMLIGKSKYEPRHD